MSRQTFSDWEEKMVWRARALANLLASGAGLASSRATILCLTKRQASGWRGCCLFCRPPSCSTCPSEARANGYLKGSSVSSVEPLETAARLARGHTKGRSRVWLASRSKNAEQPAQTEIASVSVCIWPDRERESGRTITQAPWIHPTRRQVTETTQSGRGSLLLFLLGVGLNFGRIQRASQRGNAGCWLCCLIPSKLEPRSSKEASELSARFAE